MFGWVKKLWPFGGDAGLAKRVHEVQLLLVKSCTFLPMATSVAAILTGGNPALATVAGAANAICQAAKAAKSVGNIAAGEPLKPMVEGVEVEGSYL